MSAAALKKHNDTPELIEALPQLDGLSDTDPEYEEAVHKAVAGLRQDADTLEKQGQLKLKGASDLRNKANALASKYPRNQPEHPIGPVKIGDWIGVKPARAMKQYMGQFPVGHEHRIHVKEIVKDLRKGGCVIEGELRPNETHQIAAERKIFQIVAQNDDIFAGDNEGTREIWKIK